MARCIKRVAKNVLGESRGNALLSKYASWWNEKVKADQTRLIQRLEEKQ